MVASGLPLIAFRDVNVVFIRMTNSFYVMVLFLSKSYILKISSAFAFKFAYARSERAHTNS